jgi:hypothetical protein
MNEGVISAVDIPPFLFHYIIVIVCVTYIVCVCVLKFKYLYWYSQPLTFRFTIRRFGGGGGGGGHRPRSTIMNPLSLGERCYNAVVYPFLNNVNHNSVQVYSDADANVIDAPFERIAAFLSRPETEIMMPGHRGSEKMKTEMCIPEDTLRIILSQDTFGLSVFIGVLNDPLRGADVIKGVSILTPRIMMSFESSTTSVPYQSVSIYMSEYLAWNRYTVGDRESLELLETTEYIQKSREIAGEQTLYRYRELPWFVIPFSTVYSYMFSIPASVSSYSANNRISTVPVSSTNFALFYSFVNECSRDFRCCILNELTQLQSLVDHGIYRIYMLLLNQVRVIAVYLFGSSSMKIIKPPLSMAVKTKTKKRLITKGNRISDLHEQISNTSTALVKYIPPVIKPRYDAFGKRVAMESSRTSSVGVGSLLASSSRDDDDIILLMSSIQHKSLCDITDFIHGFHLSISKIMTLPDIGIKNRHDKCIMIDTMAHNYRLIDDIIANFSSWRLLSQDKWYYILYNAIIHEQTLCKDILII